MLRDVTVNHRTLSDTQLNTKLDAYLTPRHAQNAGFLDDLYYSMHPLTVFHPHTHPQSHSLADELKSSLFELFQFARDLQQPPFELIDQSSSEKQQPQETDSVPSEAPSASSLTQAAADLAAFAFIATTTTTTTAHEEESSSQAPDTSDDTQQEQHMQVDKE